MHPHDLTLLPIQQATPQTAADAVAAATEGVEHLFSERILTNMVARAHIDCPEPLTLLLTPDGPAGWVGLVVYPEAPHTWETTTFFAPRLRGTGLFRWAKCWQAHAFTELANDSSHDLSLLTSISQANNRSVEATRRYAGAHGWTATNPPKSAPGGCSSGRRTSPTHACKTGQATFRAKAPDRMHSRATFSAKVRAEVTREATF
jgi:hypothetical protein